VLQQVKDLCKGTKAKIEVVEYDLPSYRGLRIPVEKYFPSWTLPPDHPFVEAAEGSYKSIFKKKAVLDIYKRSTAGVYTKGSANIPTLGFGPSEEAFSGPINDHARVDDMEKCMAFYANLLSYLPELDLVPEHREKRSGSSS